MNTKREGNVDAHQIAPYAMSSSQEIIWKKDEPSFIVESMGNGMIELAANILYFAMKITIFSLIIKIIRRILMC